MIALLKNSLIARLWHWFSGCYKFSHTKEWVARLLVIWKHTAIYRWSLRYIYREPSVDNSGYRRIINGFSRITGRWAQKLAHPVLSVWGQSALCRYSLGLLKAGWENGIRLIGVFMLFFGAAASILSLVKGRPVFALCLLGLAGIGAILVAAGVRLARLFQGSWLVQLLRDLIR